MATSRFSKLVQQAVDAASDPAQIQKAAHVGKAAFDGALKDVTGKDGKVKKRKIVRRALQPTKSIRRSVTGATEAVVAATQTAPVPSADARLLSEAELSPQDGELDQSDRPREV